jgi:hypothetical protein
MARLLKWEKVKLGLRVFAILMGGAAAGATQADNLILAAAFGWISTNALTLAWQLPRDRWSEEEKQARKRRSTKSAITKAPPP